MQWLNRVSVLLATAVVLSAAACSDPNDVPAVSASIEAFTGTPGVLNQGQRTSLRWRAADALTFQLEELTRSAMPDENQPWNCTREGGSMVCTAPAVPGSASGWDCGGNSCSRPIDDDEEGYRPIVIGATSIPIGSLDVWPDRTSTYRITAQGTGGVEAMAWVQVVVASEGGARIASWTAWPSPAIVGESVTLSYRTEGCDSVDTPGTTPAIPRSELVGDDANDNRRGFYTWTAATTTRDFYFACHPETEEDNEDARIRSHITVPVIQMPDVCERIEVFEAVPSTPVPAGTEVTISWSVANATSVSGEADPEPARAFYVGSARFEGTWTGAVDEETTFTLYADGECGGAVADLTVRMSEDCTPDCENDDGSDRECGDDTCGGSCGSCAVDMECDPRGICVRL